MRAHAIRIGIVAAFGSAALWGGTGIASAGGGCHATGATTSSGSAVELSDLCFDSTVLYVKPGTDVTWTNRDPLGHNVVGVAATWGDPELTLNQGDTVSYRFDENGVYPYACWIHPGMIGAIVVGDGIGTGSGGVVSGTAAEAVEPASTEAVATPVAGDERLDPVLIWVAGAALVAAGLAGGFVFATRSRRKGAVAG
jgi:plastocyanin